MKLKLTDTVVLIYKAYLVVILTVAMYASMYVMHTSI